MQIIHADNGHLQVSAYNRAVQFGDGHFTTLKLINKQVVAWPYHKNRLVEANKRLAFPQIQLEKIYQSLLDIAHQRDAVVKVLVTRGESQRGYAYSQDIIAQVYLYVSDWNHDAFSYPQGVCLSILDTQIAQQPLLAGLKHTNRLEQVLLKQELLEKSLQDGLVFDTSNRLIETSMANIIVYIDGQWCTPDLSLAGVAGTKRAELLEQNPQIKIRHIDKTEISNIHAAIMCNALIDYVVVASIENRVLDQTIAQQFIRGY
ncbi:aminodeoxychorismate lyase apoprotein [Catenovulum agarivorans DS-2]|uniref:Aminodeoxychorismate lyase n=1 Tax=Catenovulum agarivorans DS-2 TaxID=1328313 RepID=W7QA87_9ALTE|nr:aminodeoxychorismate lyase [Catenovulum agarivorans]EWH09714.1 aminodeoxychorismate lyase apoprotein [Catenovulum agarivorans DS-2]